MKSMMIQSRIDILQKKLKFKMLTNVNVDHHDNNDHNDNVDSSKMTRSSTAAFNMRQQHQGADHQSTPIISSNRSIRQEMTTNKFNALALLLQRKMEQNFDAITEDEGDNFDKNKQPISKQPKAITKTVTPPRFPSPWLTRNSLIVPDREELLGIDYKKKDMNNNNNNNNNKKNNHHNHYHKSERITFSNNNASTTRFKVKPQDFNNTNNNNNIVNISKMLLEHLEHQQLLHRKISLLLKEFYRNHYYCDKSRHHQNNNKYQSEIVYANKCLLVAGMPSNTSKLKLFSNCVYSFSYYSSLFLEEKQAIIQKKINHIHHYYDVDQSSNHHDQIETKINQNSSIARGILALRSISVPLRHHCKLIFFCVCLFLFIIISFFHIQTNSFKHIYLLFD